MSPIISLAGARRSSNTGVKAASLAALIDSGCTAPQGFVIGRDCYRVHLWASGARLTALHAAEAEEREQVREAILAAEIPTDVWSAILEACERLGTECGTSDLKLAIRSSAIEGGAGRLDFPGAYETYLNVASQAALAEAVKRVWASAWGGKAAAYRARAGIDSEPSMAVIVQRMVEADTFGSASTANIVNGDPQVVMVTSWLAGNPTSTRQHEFSLRDASWHGGSEDTEAETAATAAEQAVLVESVFGGPVEIEWAMENGALCLLQARRLSALPGYFPLDDLSEEDARLTWRRATEQPVSTFSRSLLWERDPDWPQYFPGRRDRALCLNGHVYICSSDLPETGASAKSAQGEISAASKMLTEWTQRVEPELRSKSRATLNAGLGEAGDERLRAELSQVLDTVRTAAWWLFETSYPSRRLPDLLRLSLAEAPGVADSEDLFNRLVSGLPNTGFLREALVEEFADRLTLAGESDRLEDPAWRRSLAREVVEFALDYGYSFGGRSDICDPAVWKSWAEDPDQVYRLIEADLGHNGQPTLVTRHCADQAAADEAAADLMSSLRGREKRRIGELIRLARGCSSANGEARGIYALTCTALRVALAEVSRRLADSGMIREKSDVFHLTPDELLQVLAKSPNADRASVARLVAARKHDLWLEQRLTAPAELRGADDPARVHPICMGGAGVGGRGSRRAGT